MRNRSSPIPGGGQGIHCLHLFKLRRYCPFYSLQVFTLVHDLSARFRRLYPQFYAPSGSLSIYLKIEKHVVKCLQSIYIHSIADTNVHAFLNIHNVHSNVHALDKNMNYQYAPLDNEHELCTSWTPKRPMGHNYHLPKSQFVT